MSFISRLKKIIGVFFALIISFSVLEPIQAMSETKEKSPEIELQKSLSWGLKLTDEKSINTNSEFFKNTKEIMDSSEYVDDYKVGEKVYKLYQTTKRLKIESGDIPPKTVFFIDNNGNIVIDRILMYKLSLIDFMVKNKDAINIEIEYLTDAMEENRSLYHRFRLGSKIASEGGEIAGTILSTALTSGSGGTNAVVKTTSKGLSKYFNNKMKDIPGITPDKAVLIAKTCTFNLMIMNSVIDCDAAKIFSKDLKDLSVEELKSFDSANEYYKLYNYHRNAVISGGVFFENTTKQEMPDSYVEELLMIADLELNGMLKGLSMGVIDTQNGKVDLAHLSKAEIEKLLDFGEVLLNYEKFRNGLGEIVKNLDVPFGGFPEMIRYYENRKLLTYSNNFVNGSNYKNTLEINKVFDYQQNKNISYKKAICNDDLMFRLRTDGLVTSSDYIDYPILSWSNIIDIEYIDDCLMGIDINGDTFIEGPNKELYKEVLNWKNIKEIKSNYDGDLVGLTKDGSVYVIDDDQEEKWNTNTLTNIKRVMPVYGQESFVFIDDNNEVYIYGDEININNSEWKWQNIKWLSSSDENFCVGVTNENKVIASDKELEKVIPYLGKLENIKEIYVGYDPAIVLGITVNGEAIMAQTNPKTKVLNEIETVSFESKIVGFVENYFLLENGTFKIIFKEPYDNNHSPFNDNEVFSNIKDIIYTDDYIVTLHNDKSISIKCTNPDYENPKILKYHNEKFTQIAGGNENLIVALREDGTLRIIEGRESLQYDVEKWNNLKSVACGSTILVGLKEDGTVVATRIFVKQSRYSNILDDNLLNDLMDRLKIDMSMFSEWKDIVSIDMSTNMVFDERIFGRSSDGTLYIADFSQVHPGRGIIMGRVGADKEIELYSYYPKSREKSEKYIISKDIDVSTKANLSTINRKLASYDMYEYKQLIDLLECNKVEALRLYQLIGYKDNGEIVYHNTMGRYNKLSNTELEGYKKILVVDDKVILGLDDKGVITEIRGYPKPIEGFNFYSKRLDYNISNVKDMFSPYYGIVIIILEDGRILTNKPNPDLGIY